MRPCPTAALIGAVLSQLAPTALPAEPLPVAPPPFEKPQEVLVSGQYAAEWPEGHRLVVTIQMVTPDLITLQRHSYSSVPVTFRRVDKGVFRDRQGNSLSLQGPARLTWTDPTQEISVTFQREAR